MLKISSRTLGTVDGLGGGKSKNVPAFDLKCLARGEHVSVVGINLTKPVAARAGEMKRVGCADEEGRIEAVESLGSFLQQLSADGKPRPYACFLIGKELLNNRSPPILFEVGSGVCGNDGQRGAPSDQLAVPKRCVRPLFHVLRKAAR